MRVVTLASFVGILWGLSGGFSFSVGGRTYEIAGFMVWAAHGLLRGGQRHHALHRAPADRR